MSLLFEKLGTRGASSPSYVATTSLLLVVVLPPRSLAGVHSPPSSRGVVAFAKLLPLLKEGFPGGLESSPSCRCKEVDRCTPSRTNVAAASKICAGREAPLDAIKLLPHLPRCCSLAAVVTRNEGKEGFVYLSFAVHASALKLARLPNQRAAQKA